VPRFLSADRSGGGSCAPGYHSPVAKQGDLNGWWRFGLALVGLLARLFFRPRFVGAERVPATGPAIVAANHVSSLDGIVLGLATGERARRMTRFLAAAEFFAKPWFAWALRLYRQIPLRRGEGDSGALDEAISTIRSPRIPMSRRPSARRSCAFRMTRSITPSRRLTIDYYRSSIADCRFAL